MDRTHVDQRVALDDLQRLAVEVTGLSNQVSALKCGVDDQRVAVPSPARVSQPPFDGPAGRRAVRVDITMAWTSPLEQDRHLVARLRI